MKRSVVAFLAICALPGGAAAQAALTPEQIVEHFTRGQAAAAAEPAAPGERPTGEPLSRAVLIGPTGFGTAGSGVTGGDPAPAAEQAGADPGALDLLITFEHDSARLTGTARANLDAFVEALQHPALAASRFAVDGHTDATGPESYNQVLSERRAAAVVDYLTAHGVQGERLTPRGFGETQPRTPDPVQPENRRVETRLLP